MIWQALRAMRSLSRREPARPLPLLLAGAVSGDQIGIVTDLASTIPAIEPDRIHGTVRADLGIVNANTISPAKPSAPPHRRQPSFVGVWRCRRNRRWLDGGGA
jgi:hypothetical protein